jgi:hypothetical protein
LTTGKNELCHKTCGGKKMFKVFPKLRVGKPREAEKTTVQDYD